jgi:hypothetical protein
MARKKQIPAWKDLSIAVLKPAFQILGVTGKSDRADVFKALRASLALYEVKKHRRQHLRSRTKIKGSLNKISKALDQINTERRKIFGELRREMQPPDVRREQAEQSFCDSFDQVMDVYILLDQESDPLLDKVLKTRIVVDDFTKSMAEFVAESMRRLPAKQTRSTGKDHIKVLIWLICTIFDLWFRAEDKPTNVNFEKFVELYRIGGRLPSKTIAYNETKIDFVREVFKALGLQREFGSVRDEQAVQDHTINHIKLRTENPELELFIHQQRNAWELDFL